MRTIILSIFLAGCGLSPTTDPKGNDSGQVIEDTLMIGDIQVSPPSLDFGVVQLGSEETMDVRLTNLGDYDAELSSAYLEGDTAFTLTSTSPMTMAPGESASVIVSFTPSAEQDYLGTLNLLVAGEVDIAVLDIFGTASTDVPVDTGDTDTQNTGAAALSLDSTQVDFGKVPIGTIAARTVEVTNTGGEDVLITDVTSTLGDIQGDMSVPVVLSPGESEDLLINYAPSSETEVTATVEIVSDLPSQAPTVTVTGIGYEACEICEPLLYVSTGGSDSYTMDQFKASAFNNPDEQTLTLNNYGDMDLIISAIDIVNDGDAPTELTCGTDGNYSLGSVSLPLTIPAFSYASVSVKYKYDGSAGFCGEFSIDSSVNVLTITSNSGSGSSYGITLGGGYSLL